MAMLDELFVEELVDDPIQLFEGPLQDEERAALSDENGDENEQPANPSAPSADAVRVAPKKKIIRNPQPKLNPQRLTGPRGIQVLSKSFKNVNLKGKGHELADLNTILGHLEHWANRLYPKSNFDDVLKRIEVLGHKKPVIANIKKIRLDMIDQDVEAVDSNLVLSDTENNPPVRTSDDIFNDLLASQPTLRSNTTQPIKKISQTQRERMLRNRQIAEEKRQARLKAEAERKKRDEQNVQTLNAIEFQNALIETSGHQREEILSEGLAKPDKQVTTNLTLSDNAFLCSQVSTQNDNNALGEPMNQTGPVKSLEGSTLLTAEDISSGLNDPLKVTHLTSSLNSVDNNIGQTLSDTPVGVSDNELSNTPIEKTFGVTQTLSKCSTPVNAQENIFETQTINSGIPSDDEI